MADSTFRRLAREPLVHFAVLTLFIFAFDAAFSEGGDSTRTIRIDGDVRDNLRAMFVEGQGREPSEEEAAKLVDAWLQNEVMYREARALGLDQGDEMIRERLILKMRTVLGNSIVVDPPSDDVLLAWFEENRQRYEAPVRFDIAQFLVAPPEERDLAVRMAEEVPVNIVPGEYVDRLRNYKNRSHENIVAMFGETSTRDLLAHGHDRWAVIESPRGWHLARVDQRRDPPPLDFEALRNTIEDHWRAEQENEQMVLAFRKLMDTYAVQRGTSS